MSFLAKVSTFFGLEDEDYLEEESIPSVKPKLQATTSSTRSQNEQSTFNPRKQMRATVANEPHQQQVNQSQHRTSVVEPQISNEKKVVSMRQTPVKQHTQSTATTNQAGKIMIVQPRVYSEAMTIAKHVMSGESVLVNFHLIEEHQARRIVDFLTGTVYAEDGDIKRVADEIFLCTPRGIEIDGTAQSLVDSNFFDI